MSDTARERLEAEAAEMYPVHDDDDCQCYCPECVRHVAMRRAHVRAKTMSDEQVEAAARKMHEMQVDTLWGECSSEVQADLEVQRAAFRAAGLLTEREDDA